MAPLKIFLLVLSALVAVNRASNLTFYVLGDFGGGDSAPYTTPIQLAVYYAMGVVSENKPPAFVVSLGDNIYDKGAQNEFDPRFNSTFENIYTYPTLQKRWYMALGDHDWLGNVTAQIEYTKHSSRWYMPATNYDEVIAIPNSNATLHLIVYDGWDLTWEGKNLGGPPINTANGKATLSWLEKVLVNSTATWKIVVNHFPILSAGAKGPKNPDLYATVLPILEKYSVDIHLTGHDHTMQHLVRNGINHVIVGCGAAVVPTWDAEERLDSDVNLRFKFPKTSTLNGGFGIFTVNENKLIVELIEDNSLSLYTFVIDRNPSLLQQVIPKDNATIGVVVGVICAVVLVAVVVGVVIYRRKRVAKV